MKDSIGRVFCQIVDDDDEGCSSSLGGSMVYCIVLIILMAQRRRKCRNIQAAGEAIITDSGLTRGV